MDVEKVVAVMRSTAMAEMLSPFFVLGVKQGFEEVHAIIDIY